MLATIRDDTWNMLNMQHIIQSYEKRIHLKIIWLKDTNWGITRWNEDPLYPKPFSCVHKQRKFSETEVKLSSNSTCHQWSKVPAKSLSRPSQHGPIPYRSSKVPIQGISQKGPIPCMSSKVPIQAITAWTHPIQDRQNSYPGHLTAGTHPIQDRQSSYPGHLTAGTHPIQEHQGSYPGLHSRDPSHTGASRFLSRASQ